MTQYSEDSNSEQSDNEDLQELLAHPGLYQEIQKRKRIDNQEGLQSALEELENNLPWVERLDLICSPVEAKECEDVVVDVNDDFKREAVFYHQAQAAVLAAFPRLKQLKIPTSRPVDYFAEMVKGDNQMLKIRETLLSKSKEMELRMKARKLRDLKKMGKDIQKEAVLQKNKKKKEFLDSMKKYRKDHQPEELEEFLENSNKSSKSTFLKSGNNSSGPRANKKRDYKNKKFGHGGQKKRSKRNAADSHAETKDYSKLKHNSTPKHAAKLRKKMKNSNKGGAKKNR